MAGARERRALQAWLDESGTLLDAAAAHPGAERLRGRGQVLRVPAPVGGGQWVVRHYHRGGAVASLLGDRYLRVGTPRPIREFRLGRALEELEVPTPAHVGAAVYGSGPWYRGDLVTRFVPDSRDLAAVLFPGRTLEGGTEAEGPPESPVSAESAMAAAGGLVRLLHDRGVHHPDLNLKNILLQGEDPVRALVLDLDRAVLRSRLSERARRGMLERFWRSARKWETRTGQSLPPDLRAAFEAGYSA